MRRTLFIYLFNYFYELYTWNKTSGKNLKSTYAIRLLTFDSWPFWIYEQSKHLKLHVEFKKPEARIIVSASQLQIGKWIVFENNLIFP